jgi:hypothetical protein
MSALFFKFVFHKYYFKYFLDENNQLIPHTNTNTINSRIHIEVFASNIYISQKALFIFDKININIIKLNINELNE